MGKVLLFEKPKKLVEKELQEEERKRHNEAILKAYKLLPKKKREDA